MKELNRFREFLNEDQMKNLAKLLRDEADQPDNKVGKSIFLKYAAQAEKTDVKDIKSLLGKLEDELIAKHPDTFSGEDDIVGSFLSTSKNYTVQENKGIAADYADRILGAGEGIDPIALIDFYAGNLDDLPEPMKADLFMANLKDIKARVMQENELHEGTWSLGSPEQIGSIIDGLVAIRQKADAAMDEPDAAGRGFVDGLKNQLNAEGWNSRIYRIVGDDSFHDYYDAAKKAAQLNDFDRVKNALGDAIARAKELQNAILKNRDLEENDAVLDEMAQSMGIFKEIDMMVGSIKDQMSPDDAFDSLVSEFEAISGGTKLLHRALKNIALDNNLGEIRSAYNEGKDEE